MICKNCKSNIPDDSKFCPDCGTLVKNEEELRRHAKEIVEMYPKGYNYFVKYQSLPHFVYNLRAENCEKIIAMKQQIVKKHNEICKEEKAKQDRIRQEKQAQEERKRREQQAQHDKQRLESKRNQVSTLKKLYPYGFKYYHDLGLIPDGYYISEEDCDKILSYESEIKEKKETHPARAFYVVPLGVVIMIGTFIGSLKILGSFLNIGLAFLLSCIVSIALAVNLTVDMYE